MKDCHKVHFLLSLTMTYSRPEMTSESEVVLTWPHTQNLKLSRTWRHITLL